MINFSLEFSNIMYADLIHKRKFISVEVWSYIKFILNHSIGRGRRPRIAYYILCIHGVSGFRKSEKICTLSSLSKISIFYIIHVNSFNESNQHNCLVEKREKGTKNNTERIINKLSEKKMKFVEWVDKKHKTGGVQQRIICFLIIETTISYFNQKI